MRNRCPAASVPTRARSRADPQSWTLCSGRDDPHRVPLRSSFQVRAAWHLGGAAPHGPAARSAFARSFDAPTRLGILSRDPPVPPHSCRRPSRTIWTAKPAESASRSCWDRPRGRASFRDWNSRRGPPQSASASPGPPHRVRATNYQAVSVSSPSSPPILPANSVRDKHSLPTPARIALPARARSPRARVAHIYSRSPRAGHPHTKSQFQP
mmetsp:Transcript_26382/g.66547  ORF Transcript_26382/g.66547 Transcript_26382/m.66547 type:complete len:211 (+) Transcript_26382:1421-2053(+)